jgi:hypothetical protein
MGDWTVNVRRPDLTLEGELDDYTDLEMIPRFNATGVWSLKVHADAALASALAQPRWGIQVIHNPTGSTVLSGTTRLIDKVRTPDSHEWEIHGFDDNVWLERREVKPQPATSSPPYSTDEYDVRTGVGSTILRQYVDVNAGVSATSERRVVGLGLGVDPLVGDSVTGRGRWQILMDLLQELAAKAGGIGFRVVQVGSTLEFQTFQPIDRTATVIFSLETQTLGGYRYSIEVPSVNYVYVGGGGEGTARTIRERANTTEIALWDRIERFVDRRDTSDTAELDAEGDKQLAEGATAKSLAWTAIDRPGQTYLSHYSNGDRCTAVIDGESISDVVQETRIKLVGGEATKIAPFIGTPGAPAVSSPGDETSPVLRIFRRVQEAERRLRDLERR